MNITGQRGPLHGTRVLDLATNHFAYAARLLADLGAEVIRVEDPSGDPLRSVGPHIVGPNGERVSAAYAFLNANKKAVALKLTCAEGQELFGDLVATADVVIESFAPTTLTALGIGYETMRKCNPRVIVISITPYGQTGPKALDRAVDITLLAAGGLLSLGGYRDTGPIAVPGEQGHYASAIFGAVSALAGLLQRQSTNRGQWFDVSGQECVAFALEDAIPEWYLNHRIRRRSTEGAREAGTGIYPCKDGFISIVAGRLGTAKAFIALTRWIAGSGTEGCEELLEERWNEFAFRQSAEGIARFELIFGRFCATRGKQDLYREGQARQIAIAPVNTIAEVLEDEQLVANGFFQQLFDPKLGRPLTFPGPPYRLQRTPASIRSSAPREREYERALYIDELGMTEARFTELRLSGVV